MTLRTVKKWARQLSPGWNAHLRRHDHLATEIIQRRKDGETYKSIARTYGISIDVISKILRRHAPEILKVPRRVWRWSGGRRIDQNGYVIIPIDRSHPFFEAMHFDTGRSDTSPRVFEHRLVMAEYLGRPLLRSETVHHIDGNRSHNAIVNLQLRMSNHGPGITLMCRSCGSHDVIAMPFAEQTIKANLDTPTSQ